MIEQPQSDDLIAAVDGAAYPLNNEECVFRTRAGGERHVTTLEVLRALDVCSRFQTFEEHVRSVTGTQEQLRGREDAVRGLLSSAIRQGLFVSAHDLLAGPAASPPDDPTGPVPVFIRAGGRVAQLEALLESALHLESRFGHRHRYFAITDAGDGESEDALRRVVEQAAQRGLDCRLLDRAWQRQFVSRVLELAGHAGDTELEAVLLGGQGVDTGAGRLRNLTSLVAAGVGHLMLDEDLVLAPRRDPSLAGGPALAATDWQMWFAEDSEGVREWGESADFDPVYEHYRALDLSGLQALRRYGGDPGRLAGVDNRALQRMARGPLLATQSGIYGDAATTSNIWFFTARGASRERLCADETVYQRLRTSRYVVRVRADHAFQPVAAFCPIGGSGGSMLPPTAHVGRNEDLFYSRALSAVYPDARVLEFPWALGHFPEPRNWPEVAWDQPFSGNLPRLLSAEIAGLAQEVPEMSVAARFRMLGEHLGSLAALPDDELLERIVQFHVTQRATWIEALQRNLLGVSRRLPAWERDIRAIIEVNGRSLEAGVERRLADMPSGLDDADAAAWLRQRISQLARAYRAWPDLWAAAPQVRDLPELESNAKASRLRRGARA